MYYIVRSLFQIILTWAAGALSTSLSTCGWGRRSTRFTWRDYIWFWFQASLCTSTPDFRCSCKHLPSITSWYDAKKALQMLFYKNMWYPDNYQHIEASPLDMIWCWKSIANAIFANTIDIPRKCQHIQASPPDMIWCWKSIANTYDIPTITNILKHHLLLLLLYHWSELPLHRLLWGNWSELSGGWKGESDDGNHVDGDSSIRHKA